MTSAQKYIHFYATSSKDDSYNLKREYDQIFESVKVGSNYQKAVPQNPFDLANENFWMKDRTTNYLNPVFHLQVQAENYTTSSEESFFVQALATYTSFISNEQDSLEALWTAWRKLSYLKAIQQPSPKVVGEEALQHVLWSVMMTFRQIEKKDKPRIFLKELSKNCKRKPLVYLLQKKQKKYA